MADSDEETYEVPLRDQRYFGAGLKRKRVHFVPSSDTAIASKETISSHGTTPPSASEQYLAIVFNSASSEHSHIPTPVFPKTGVNCGNLTSPGLQASAAESPYAYASVYICNTCHLPISVSEASASAPHEASIAHQVCLPHTHPPSSLDRTRKGVSILQSYGWNPDQRVGLGATGTGILHPVKVKEKRDTVGLGVGSGHDHAKERKRKPPPRESVVKLDAGKIQKMDIEGRKKDQRLREMFYSHDDVEKYLGGG